MRVFKPGNKVIRTISDNNYSDGKKVLKVGQVTTVIEPTWETFEGFVATAGDDGTVYFSNNPEYFELVKEPTEEKPMYKTVDDFKIGDRVKRINLSNGMGFYKGTCGTVVALKNEYGGLYSYVVVQPDAPGSWANNNNPENLEILTTSNQAPFEVLEDVRIIIQGHAVVVIAKDGRKGKALCDPTDEFNLGKGLELALARMLEK